MHANTLIDFKSKNITYRKLAEKSAVL